MSEEKHATEIYEDLKSTMEMMMRLIIIQGIELDQITESVRSICDILIEEDPRRRFILPMFKVE